MEPSEESEREETKEYAEKGCNEGSKNRGDSAWSDLEDKIKDGNNWKAFVCGFML